jgi:hypothetical protein
MYHKLHVTSCFWSIWTYCEIFEVGSHLYIQIIHYHYQLSFTINYQIKQQIIHYELGTESLPGPSGMDTSVHRPAACWWLQTEPQCISRIYPIRFNRLLSIIAPHGWTTWQLPVEPHLGPTMKGGWLIINFNYWKMQKAHHTRLMSTSRPTYYQEQQKTAWQQFSHWHSSLTSSSPLRFHPGQ